MPIYPQIKVFVTKTRKFRAKIQETKDSIPYEVTIGGQEWREGKGRKYREVIKNKMQRTLMLLSIEILKG